VHVKSETHSAKNAIKGSKKALLMRAGLGEFTKGNHNRWGLVEKDTDKKSQRVKNVKSESGERPGEG